MAKRELSSNLKNLKFMQRAAAKPKNEEEEKPVISTGNRKCIVIMEGNPHPGAIKGRMSFQSFNPSIDKLNEPEESPSEPANVPSPANTVDGKTPECNRGLNEFIRPPGNDSEGDHHKRKHPEETLEYPNKSPKNVMGQRGSSSNNSGKSSRGLKQKKQRDKLSFNLLRPSSKVQDRN
ncbi:hypothetical protein ACHQM5_020240 [Ranunculus cassubicifolius]